MFEGLMQPMHLLVFVAALGGLWLVVRIIRKAWKGN